MSIYEIASPRVVPSPARIYDYYLGGKDNYEVDRQAAEKALSAVPYGREIAHANRGFLIRAVTLMAERGISQFIDLGTGIPTSPSVHETARAINPDARIVYVDNDPIVTTHNQALLAGDDHKILAMHGDIRAPHTILARERMWQLIDFSQPVGVLLVAVLHFILDEDDPEASVTAFTQNMAPGSCLALSHITSDGTPPDVIATIHDAYRIATAPAVFRTREQIQLLFTGLQLIQPGLTDLTDWQAPSGRRPPGALSLRLLTGIGTKAATLTAQSPTSVMHDATPPGDEVSARWSSSAHAS